MFLESSNGLRTMVNQKFIKPSILESSDIDDVYQAISVYMGDPIGGMCR